MKVKRWEINLEAVAKALCNIVRPPSGWDVSQNQNYPQLYVAGTMYTLTVQLVSCRNTSTSI